MGEMKQSGVALEQPVTAPPEPAEGSEQHDFQRTKGPSKTFGGTNWPCAVGSAGPSVLPLHAGEGSLSHAVTPPGAFSRPSLRIISAAPLARKIV